MSGGDRNSSGLAVPDRRLQRGNACTSADELDKRQPAELGPFLFRNVPGDVNWFQTLGSATLTAFIVQALTGVILAMYYKPDPNSAYESIQNITNHLFAGWLVRGMHRWGASVFIILMFMHMGRVFMFF